MAVTLVLLAIIIVLITALLVLLKSRYNYWKDRNVPSETPSLLFGNMKGVGTEFAIFQRFREIYKKFKGSAPFVGFYFFFKPAVFVLDVELVKNILIKDFNSFTDRGQYVNERDDPLTGHLFSLEGKKWKSIRQKLSPTFTSGKMRLMFPAVLEIGNRFVKVLEETVKHGSVVEIKELNARFTTDVIGTCAFGLECNSLMDPNTEFLDMGKKAFNKHRHYAVVEIFINSFPKLAAKLRLKIIPDDVSAFFMKVVRETVEYRERNNVQRNDFMNMLIDLKNNNDIAKGENGEDLGSGLTMNEISAQSFVFFLAGFETSSTTMSFCLYELARNPQIQDRLRQEINEVFEKNGGNLNYESMKEMRYMEQVISETLRKYTVVQTLAREAYHDYKVPGTDLVIEQGTLVFIPSDSIHFNPEYYPDPEKFDPDRFTPEEIQKRPSCSWLAFGEGPRNCIGLRFGKMQARIGLAELIRNFKFSTSDKTEVPLKFDPKSFVLSPVNGIYLRVDKI